RPPPDSPPLARLRPARALDRPRRPPPRRPPGHPHPDRDIRLGPPAAAARPRPLDRRPGARRRPLPRSPPPPPPRRRRPPRALRRPLARPGRRALRRPRPARLGPRLGTGAPLARRTARRLGGRPGAPSGALPRCQALRRRGRPRPRRPPGGLAHRARPP